MTDDVSMTWQYGGHVVVSFSFLGCLMRKIRMTCVTPEEMPRGNDDINLTYLKGQHIEGQKYQNSFIKAF